MAPQTSPPAPAGWEGSARWFAVLYASEPLRPILEALLGIEWQINAVLRSGLEHSVAHVRMQWWQEECARAAAGNGAHPLTRALLAARPVAATAGADLTGLLDTAAWDLAAATFATRKELTGYCERWASAMTVLAARWAAPRSMAPDAATMLGRALGIPLRELELLNDLRPAALAGRLRLPLDELEGSAIEPGALTAAAATPALAALLRRRHEELRGQLQAVLAGISDPAQREAFRGLIVWARLVMRHSQLAERALPATWLPSKRSRLGDAWQAWRYARRD